MDINNNAVSPGSSAKCHGRGILRGKLVSTSPVEETQGFLQERCSSVSSGEQPMDYDNPNKPREEPVDDLDSINCDYCNRPLAEVICNSCGYMMTGRVRQHCPHHPVIIQLMDHIRCPKCRSSRLQEFCVTPTKANKMLATSSPASQLPTTPKSALGPGAEGEFWG